MAVPIRKQETNNVITLSLVNGKLAKKPKVKYNIIPTGVFCKVICKPLFRKEHLSVECGQPGEICDRAEKKAFEEWNRRADDGT
jgi:hypothetical protein